jgi:dCTP deaminase
MIINGTKLLQMKPLEPMVDSKIRQHGVSYGLSEAGYDIRIKQSVNLRPDNRFSLASTLEHFRMPKDMVAIVHDKSTWARRGLSVFNTVIEPGWHGYLTLELVYHGDAIVNIPAGAGIAQVIFHRLLEFGDYGYGKYQNQEDQPVGPRG